MADFIKCAILEIELSTFYNKIDPNKGGTMDQILHILAGYFWSLLILFSPILFLDLAFNNGKITKKIFKGLMGLVAAIPGYILGGFGSGIKAGWQKKKEKKEEKNKKQVEIHVHHHHHGP